MSFSRFRSRSHSAAQVLLASALLLAPPAQACSVCGCSLSDDWGGESYAMMQGWEADLRFEYADFSQLRAGTGTVARGELEFPNDREIQQETLNRTVWAGFDYAAGPKWGVDVQAPYYSRYHTTIAPGDTSVSTSRGRGIGDVRVLSRWHNFSLARSLAVQFGLKLPTGSFDQNFSAGPAAGTPLDRGLQRGTGTTDAILGVSYFARPAVNWGCFAQVLGQQALAARDGFLPSSSVLVNAGVRYLNESRFTPQLQINARWDTREHGANADRDNSGDSIVQVSPGLSAELTTQATAFAFVQLPVGERVNGFQLEPRWQLSTGVRWKF